MLKLLIETHSKQYCAYLNYLISLWEVWTLKDHRFSWRRLSSKQDFSGVRGIKHASIENMRVNYF